MNTLYTTSISANILPIFGLTKTEFAAYALVIFVAVALVIGFATLLYDALSQAKTALFGDQSEYKPNQSSNRILTPEEQLERDIQEEIARDNEGLN